MHPTITDYLLWAFVIAAMVAIGLLGAQILSLPPGGCP